MRILFVLENYYPNVGGVETLFKNLLEQLSASGNQVTLITTRLEKSHPSKEIIDNITIYRYPFHNRYIFTLFAVFPILYHAGKCDIIHTTSYNAGIPAFLGAFFRRKKSVITFHEVWGPLWDRLPYMGTLIKKGHYWFEQLLLKLPFTNFVAVSKNTARRLKEEGVKSSKIVLNYNGIDYRPFEKTSIEKNTKEERFVYTYYGRLGMSKGIDLLLEACAQLKQEGANALLQLIIPTSPASFYNTILEHIKKHDLQDHIRIKNSLPYPELITTLKASHCVVVPSYSEGFCFVAVESIAMGIPIISSDQAALKEVVSGQFIKMEDFNTKALVKALHQAMANEWEYLPIRKFELADNTKGYINLYEKILGK